MNVYLSERQNRQIKRALMLEQVLPNETSIISSIDNLLVKKLYAERLQEVTSCFSDDVSSVSKNEIIAKVNKISNICRKKEQNIRPQLEQICFNTLLELFNIPKDTVTFECHLVDEIKSDRTFRVNPNTSEEEEYEDYDAIENEQSEIEKRKIIQALYIGGAINLYEASRKLFINDIFDLDEDLPHLYSKFIKVNNLSLVVCNIKNTDRRHNQGGYAKIELGNDEKQSKITVEAINFPILLTESIRGFMELFASYGLPDSQKEASKILSIVDVLQDEPWYMKYGPVLWNRVISLCDGIDTTEIPYFFKNIVELPSADFNHILREVFYNTRKGREMLSQIKQSAIHDKEYGDFENDMMAKQDRRTLIDDSFTPEELEEPLLEDYLSERYYE